MITYIKINGFKSFHNFEMEFTPFTVIAGVNASGKSNLFDALKLLGRLAEVDHLKKAFREQRGEFKELFSQLGADDYATEMEFVVEMLVDKKVKDAWGNEATLKYTRLRYELKIKRYVNDSGIEELAVVYEHLKNLTSIEDKWIKRVPKDFVNYWSPKIETEDRSFSYIETAIASDNGVLRAIISEDDIIPQITQFTNSRREFPLLNASRTILSTFDYIGFTHALAAQNEMKSWNFLQLNPDDLRQPTSKSTGDDNITETGKNLAAALYRIKKVDPYSLILISNKLQSFIPEFIGVDVVDDIENGQYIIKLTDKHKKKYSARVLSEGTLRVLALCILEEDFNHNSLLCFEEPENGIHALRIKTMVDLLYDLSVDFNNINMPLRQVIVNTHSPVLVSLVYNWVNKNDVSIWYAQLRNRVTDINSKRYSLSITSILPVVKEESVQPNIPFSEQDKKLTLTRVKNYLEFGTSENHEIL